MDRLTVNCHACGGLISKDALRLNSDLSCPHCRDPYVTIDRKQQADINRKRHAELFVQSMRRVSGLCVDCGGERNYLGFFKGKEERLIVEYSPNNVNSGKTWVSYSLYKVYKCNNCGRRDDVWERSASHYE